MGHTSRWQTTSGYKVSYTVKKGQTLRSERRKVERNEDTDMGRPNEAGSYKGHTVGQGPRRQEVNKAAIPKVGSIKIGRAHV